ncbi:hypothetical protein [Calidifontibacillus erzurumensis]|uniref:hypothetical protein n=1 Tax=Calidifontibacillus erzurumensis TaxID=2741433 RepID=UPI0035B50B2A
MLKASKNNANFTKTGFSKAGFACCGHWQECQMGKLECIYAESDPEVKNYCKCYVRNHNSKPSDKNVIVTDSEIDEFLSKIDDKVIDEILQKSENEQLDIFDFFQIV